MVGRNWGGGGDAFVTVIFSMLNFKGKFSSREGGTVVQGRLMQFGV